MTPNRQGLRVSGIRQLPPERSVRDARQLRALAAPYPLRQLACQMTRRHRAQITALGVAGVCGFVAALACLRTGLWGSVAYVAAVTAIRNRRKLPAQGLRIVGSRGGRASYGTC